MLDLLAIFAAIVFIMLVLQLRAMLALPFASQTARLAPGDWSKLLAAEDVIATASAELAPLGFEGPVWLSVSTQPAEAGNVRAMACFRRAQDGVLVFLVPLFLAETPNRCISYLVTRLNDGRSIVSQPSDPYFTLTASAEEPAQLLPPAPFADLVKAHLAFVDTQGTVAVDATSEAVMVDLAGRWLNARRARLLAAGAISETADGIARPTLGFALRALRAFWARPKWAANTTPIPPARLTLIAQNTVRIRERAPTAAMQWLLFLVSNALFMAVGALVFGARFALILLVVIIIHEAGHYLAMRAFGYRNVQMLALPLVGGVTVGHERDPHATQRAWMSLMGPLPGIVIGWILLAISWQGSGLAHDWLAQAAWVFLAVNYLNVLPILPLDGGHIVQAMLPARWYSLRIAFLLMACALGALACYAFGLIGLAVVVLLQLLQVPVLLQNRRVIKHLLATGTIGADGLRARKLRLAFDAFDQVAGPSTHASARIAQAEDIVRSLEVVPMGWTSRLLTGGVYTILLAVPVLAFALMWSLWTQPEITVPNDSERAMAFSATADSNWPDLLAPLEPGPWWQRLLRAEEGWAGPATAAGIAATEQRLGVVLPPELAEFYARHDGATSLQLGEVAAIAPLLPPAAAMQDVAAAMLETPFDLVDIDGDSGVRLRLRDEDLLACFTLSPKTAPTEPLAWPALLWCPSLDGAGAAIVSAPRHRAWRDFKVYVRERAAETGVTRD